MIGDGEPVNSGLSPAAIGVSSDVLPREVVDITHNVVLDIHFKDLCDFSDEFGDYPEGISLKLLQESWR
jgi:hypothetical protein